MFSLLIAAAVAATPYPVAETSISDIAADLAAGRTTSVAVVDAYLARIEALDRNGPALRSVLSINRHVRADARAADAARAAGKPLGPLAGIPLLIKDNIDTVEGATTAGSLALAANVTKRDAPLVRRLRDAGALILGKTNLSEWANIRGSRSISGWSGVGGLTKNPYVLDRTPCGSSAGTGAAVAASLAAAGVGTETDGSIVCPASANGLVGLKPTVGLVSRTHVIPISATQDTAGPMARSAADAARLLTALAGSDPADPATTEADARKTDYVAALAGATLKGKKLAVLGYAAKLDPATAALFGATLDRLRAAGAEIVEVADWKPDPGLGDAERIVLVTELKARLNAYLASTPANVRTRTLADVIAFNAANARELALFGQDTFADAEATKGLADPAYLAAKAKARRLAGPEGIDKLLAETGADALVASSYGPAGRVDMLGGTRISGSVSTLAAVAGTPHLTVPMGQVAGLPVGFSFLGPAWSEAKLLALGAAFEALIGGRMPPAYRPSIEDEPRTRALFAPAPDR